MRRKEVRSERQEKMTTEEGEKKTRMGTERQTDACLTAVEIDGSNFSSKIEAGTQRIGR